MTRSPPASSRSCRPSWPPHLGRGRRARSEAWTAELHTGDGLAATAAIAAETTRRVLGGAKPGAWTAGRLFGAGLVTDAIDAHVTVSPGR
jgi:hypothetical protein